MSKSEVQRLHQDALQDLALQERLKQAQNNGNLIDLVMELGQEKGYSFTKLEAEEYINEVNGSDSQQDISEEQLEAISGGLSDTVVNTYSPSFHDITTVNTGSSCGCGQ